MTVFHVHQAGLASAAVIAELQARCFTGGVAVEEVWQPTAVAAFLAQPGVIALIASHDDAPVAFLLARCVADEAEILSLGVLQAWRRQGLARRLLREAGRLCRLRGADRLHLEVAADNTAALALYEGEAFRRVGCRPAYYRRPDGSRAAAVLLMQCRPGGDSSS